MCKQVVLEELLECSLMRPVWGENCGQKTKGVAWLHAASEISYPILASCSKTIAKRAVAWAAYPRSKEAGLFVVTCYIPLMELKKLLIAGRWKNLSWWATFAAFSNESAQMMKVSQKSSCRRPGVLSFYPSHSLCFSKLRAFWKTVFACGQDDRVS